MSIAVQVEPARVAPEIAATLAGRHFGLFGFDAGETARIAAILGTVDAVGTRFEETWLGGSAGLGDAVLIKLGAVGLGALREAAVASVPVLIAGAGESLLEGAARAYEWPHDFLAEPWSDAELLVRLFRLVAPARERTAHSERRPQPLILLADDDPCWASLVEANLRAHSLTCRTASNGLAALRLARQLAPDLLVLDVKMPGLDGFQVLETIRRDPLLEHLPVTLLTGCDEQGAVSRGSELRAADYVVKPVSPTVLLNRIKRVLAATQADAARPEAAAGASVPKAPNEGASLVGGIRGQETQPGLDALRTQYLENRVREQAALAEALRGSDFAALSRAGHNLKGTGAAYGFDELTELGKALESAAKQEDARQVEVLLGKIEFYLTQVKAGAAPR